MEKFILIDGNSLLNRAFYAMGVISTKDGLPTNGIFGFTKLVLKIIEEKNPKYFAVAFDLRAPTFRHKMYDGYKATRKPMPEELARQVPVLKELLRAMNICIVEKEGFEADDILGTLSVKFEGVEVFIYTGDRDSYQLVREGVNVCFTKRGVSDIDLMTSENFFEKVGLTPAQIIEEKSLMGDSSDNIPGVSGIGQKGAVQLLRQYETLDGIYRHLDELTPSLRGKLEKSRESAYLSRTLATIDTNVPLSVDLRDCELKIPFSEEARQSFTRLEFRSLLGSRYFEVQEKRKTESVAFCTVKDVRSFLEGLNGVDEASFCLTQGGFHVYFQGTEYAFAVKEGILDEGLTAGEVAEVLEGLFRNRRILAEDVKAVFRYLNDFGVKVDCPVEDVMLLRYLGDSNLKPTPLKAFTTDFSLSETLLAYALKLVYDEARAKTDGTEEEKLYRELELPLTRVLLDMENTGIRVDLKMFPVLQKEYQDELDALTRQINSMTGTSCNLNSPFQLSDLLFNRLGLKVKGAKKNSRGGYSTKAEVLEQLADEHEVVRLILRYRELQKRLSTYVDGIRPLVKGDVVHTTYNQIMTTTGRLSSANPNLQNIPVRTDEGKLLRKMFIAREGNVLIDADYSQIELRILAHLSDCPSLIEAYRRGDDVHAATAAQVFGVPLDKVTPLQRRRAKVVNFGIIYGMGAYSLAKDLGCPNWEAQEIIDRYYEKHPEVKEFMAENVKRAKEDGYVTTILGRKRYIPEARSSAFQVRSFGERAAMNMPLQGSSADIIKIAMLRVYERLKREGFRAKIVLQVHDELILDAPEAEKERAAAILKEEMEGAVYLKVPLTVEVAMGKSWYDAK